MSILFEDAYYSKLIEKMGDYYDDSEPLLIICDNIIKYNYEDLFIYGWEDNIYGIWSREKMIEDYRKVCTISNSSIYY
jgi:hypothetical protein